MLNQHQIEEMAELHSRFVNNEVNRIKSLDDDEFAKTYCAEFGIEHNDFGFDYGFDVESYIENSEITAYCNLSQKIGHNA